MTYVQRFGRLGGRNRAAPAVLILLAGVLLLTQCGSDSPSAPEPGVPPEWVPLSPGEFLTGSPAGEEAGPGRATNETQHEVTFTHGMEVLSTEVSQDLWGEIMGWNESFWKGGGLPAENLTFFDAIEFCNRLSQRDSLIPAYVITRIHRDGVHIDSADVVWNREAAGYRLLTEAEWEYCARAGTETAYYGGPIESAESTCRVEPALEPYAWYCANSGLKTHAIGTKPANDWGLFDMLGNVWEWCWDRGDTTYTQAVVDPTGAVNRTNRAVRGGSWGATTIYCRAATRSWLPPETRGNYIGLRIARIR